MTLGRRLNLVKATCVTHAEASLPCPQELSAMASITSRHVVKYLGIVYETDEAGNRLHTGFLMEKMSGTLFDYIDR